MERTDSITNLLKAYRAEISAVRANKALVALGLLEEKDRPSSKYPGKIKRFKALTEQGLKYGVNVENPSSPGQTTPHYYTDGFEELLMLIWDQIAMDAEGGKGRPVIVDEIPF